VPPDGDLTSAHDAASWEVCVLLTAATVCYVIVGLPLFVAPNWAAEHFAWRVSPFVAMTAGAWCLGTAAFGAYVVNRRQVRIVRASVLYVFSFGVTQLGVAVYERERLLTQVLTWPYLAALLLSVAGAGLALAQGRRLLGPDRSTGEPPVTPLMRLMMVGFIALVFFLAGVAFAAPPKSRSGAVFPEPLSLFSLRAFGVFYLSLGVAMLLLVADRRAQSFLLYMRAGLVLVLVILVATAVYGGTFDLEQHPYQLLYPIAYVVALVGSVGCLLWERGRRQTTTTTTRS
jgi:hypothetical protein